jgi:hypothetical protein
MPFCGFFGCEDRLKTINMIKIHVEAQVSILHEYLEVFLWGVQVVKDALFYGHHLK